MSKFKIFYCSLFIIHCSFFTIGLFAQNYIQNSEQKPEQEKHKIIYGNVYAGISVPVLGDRYWNRDWEPNYMFAGSVFAEVSKRLMLGVRVEFNHWIGYQYALTGDYPLTVDWSVIKASTNIIEISPVARYIMFSEYKKSNVFLQMGIGYYDVIGSYNLSGVYLDNTGNTIYINPNEKWNYSKAGISLGCGIKSGFVEILPIYNIIFTNFSYTQYVTINVGIDF